MAQVIDFKNQYTESINKLIREYDTKLEAGVYHLRKFRVYFNPICHKLTAYLDCEEGKFYCISALMIYDLKSAVGTLINKIIDSGNIVKIDVVYLLLKQGKASGLTINVGQKY